MWNPGRNSPPPDFYSILYGEESEAEEEEEEEIWEDFGDEGEAIYLDVSDEEMDLTRASPSPPPPVYSPITRPTSPDLSPASSRSRSPLRSRSRSWSQSQSQSQSPSSISRLPVLISGMDAMEPHGNILALYDEDGTLLDEGLALDSHALFESVERERSLDRGNSRGRSLRGRVRGGRGGRVRNRGQGRGRGGQRRSRQHGWQPGQPLEEVWMTDDDVPPQLREMVRDVVRRRQARLEGLQVRRQGVRANEVTEMRENNSQSENDDDVFEDAIDGRGNSFLEGVDLHFEWSPMETFRSVEETFVPERTGSVSSYSNPYDAFRSFWDDSILQVIVEETNRYASRIQSACFQAEWHPINVHELLCLFAFWMMTGIIRMPTITSYFSNNSLLKTEIFSRITTQKRYINLNRALHFVDLDSTNPTNSDAATFDPVHRLRPIIDHLNIKFQSNYVPSKDICLDESLTLWKGRLKFKQYIRSKAAKFGIKTFELCESATGYLWSFLVYTGRQNAIEFGIAKSTAIVLNLIKPLLKKGYRLFMDNWFNSPLLARILKRNGTDCVGTLRASRVDVPKIVTQAPLKQGQLVARHSGDVCVLSWLDKKRINMISTCHGSATGLSRVSSDPPARPEPFKPQSVLDYNRAMGGVDLKDQMLEPYLLERKRCTKWYLKLFKRLLNCSIHNSRILLESSLQARQDHLQFRLELVHAILLHHLSFIPLARKSVASQNRTAHIHHIVHHTHWPVRIPQTDKDRLKRIQSRQKCVVCLREGRKSQKSYYKCEDCGVPLCVVNCFKKYHTSLS